MNKYIYRFIFASLCILCFLGSPAIYQFLGIAAIASLPFILLFYELIGSITGQPSNVFGGDVSPLNELIYIIALICVCVALLYWFFSSWARAELQDRPEEFQAKVTIGLRVFFLGLAAWFIIPAVSYSIPKMKDFSHSEQMTHVDADELRIENYKETPIHLWNSTEPVGVRVEFDLVGNGQQGLMTSSFNYKVQAGGGLNLYGQCLTDDPQMEALKKSREVGKTDMYQSYLLQNPDRNRMVYKCYSPLFLKFALRYVYICPHENAEALLSAMPRIRKASLSMYIDSTESGSRVRHLDAILERDIPKQTLLLNPAFWLKAELQFDKVTLPEGDTICLYTDPINYVERPCICHDKTKMPAL